MKLVIEWASALVPPTPFLLVCYNAAHARDSSGSCSEGLEAFEGAKGQFRKPTKSLLGLHGGGLSFLGLQPVPREAVVVGAARRQQWKLQRSL